MSDSIEDRLRAVAATYDDDVSEQDRQRFSATVFDRLQLPPPFDEAPEVTYCALAEEAAGTHPAHGSCAGLP